MTYRHHIRVDDESLPNQAYRELCALAPWARKHYGFHLQLDTATPDGGEIVRKITGLCARHGLRRGRTVGRGEYGHYVDRHFGDDINEFELLMLNNQVITRAGVIGNRFVGAVDASWRAANLLGFSQQVVVSEEVRSELEKPGLVGLEFGASPLSPQRFGTQNAEEWLAEERALKRPGLMPGSFWELKSSITLPKMANTHRLMQDGLRGSPPQPFGGDYSQRVFISDPPFSKGEVHYSRSGTASLGQFDIAQTIEKYMAPVPALVISQRFYQYCLRNGIGLNAEPVHIDPN